ncbi:hypothetical protein [Kitasatospora sp. NPDC088779]|uniref:hypothetical protein n=1 Tax=unclassified Kitasatospora TaxID=2633591 RepID=UPI00344A47DB
MERVLAGDDRLGKGNSTLSKEQFVKALSLLGAEDSGRAIEPVSGWLFLLADTDKRGHLDLDKFTRLVQATSDAPAHVANKAFDRAHAPSEDMVSRHGLAASAREFLYRPQRETTAGSLLLGLQ